MTRVKSREVAYGSIGELHPDLQGAAGAAGIFANSNGQPVLGTETITATRDTQWDSDDHFASHLEKTFTPSIASDQTLNLGESVSFTNDVYGNLEFSDTRSVKTDVSAGSFSGSVWNAPPTTVVIPGAYDESLSSADGDALDLGFYDQENFHSHNYRGQTIDTLFSPILSPGPNNNQLTWDDPDDANLGGGPNMLAGEPNTSAFPTSLAEVSTSLFVEGCFVPPGHHWLPVSIINSFMNSIDADARYWSYAYTSGKLNEIHNWGSVYNGVS